VSRRDEGQENPDRPGWYPDPWSATGTGERYFDGKTWGTNERPLGRNTIALSDVRKKRRRSKATQRFTRVARPAAVIAGLLAVGWLFTLIQHHGSHATRIVLPPPVSSSTERSTHHPPPSTEEAARPLGTPAPVPKGPGKFEVIAHQADAPTIPVAFDPCRPIHYVINVKGAPGDGAALIRDSFARLHTATGLLFIDDGLTTEPARKERPPYQPGRYSPSRWAPVLIAWSDETAYPELAGYITGVTSSPSVYATPDRRVYITSEVVLDDQQLSTAKMPDRREVRATILHELGHAVGLDHTSDRTQLMFSQAQGNVFDYGLGDRRGLALLGTQACFPNT